MEMRILIYFCHDVHAWDEKVKEPRGSTAPAVVPPTVSGFKQKKEEQATQAVVPPHSTARLVLPGNLER